MLKHHINALFKRITEFWDTHKYCDVQVKIRDQTFYCHKPILALFSTYFKSKLPEATNGFINAALKNDSPSEFEAVLNFLYKEWHVNGSTCRDIYGYRLKKILRSFEIDLLTSNKQCFADRTKHGNAVVYTRRLQVVRGLKMLLKSGIGSDIRIIVEDKTFHCHKLVLAAASPYFDAMFSTCMRESESGEVKLQGLEKNTFKKVLKYIYSGESIVTCRNAKELLSVSVYLQVVTLQELCEKCLVHNITTQNALLFWRLATSVGTQHLASHSLSHILGNFKSFSRTPEFLLLTFEELSCIFMSDEINVETGDEIVEAASRWTNHQRNSVFAKDIQCQEQLQNLCKFFALNETLENNGIQSRNDSNSMERISINTNRNWHEVTSLEDVDIHRKEEVLLAMAVFGRSRSGGHVLRTACYSFAKKNWFMLPSLKVYMGVGVASCNFRNDIFISGGGRNCDELMHFSTTTNKWKQRASMTECRLCHAMASFEGSIFVLGGLNNNNMNILSSIERYDISSDTWEHAGDLLIPVFDASCAVLGDKILIFGGRLSLEETTRVVQCFDPVTGTCSNVASLPVQCQFPGTVVGNNDDLYYICSAGNVIRCTEWDTPKTVGSAGSGISNAAVIVLFQGSILGIGGRQHRIKLQTFDVRKGKNCISEDQARITLPWDERRTENLFGYTVSISRKFLYK